MEEWLEHLTNSIAPLDRDLLDESQERLDSLTKSRGSLGRLGELGKRFVAIRGDLKAWVENKVVFVFAADHGVLEEEVGAFPKGVTAQVVYNFLRGGGGINVVARQTGADVVVVDIGVNHFLRPTPGVFHAKVRMGTENMAKGPAMSREDALVSIKMGVEVAFHYAHKGYNLFAAGDVGVGNTIPSSAVFSAITARPSEEVTGRGTGITDEETLKREAEAVRRVLEVNKPDPSDPVDLLSKVGGLEIGGIAGLILGGAVLRIPVVVDSLASTAGALIASSLCPKVKDYIVCTHRSVAFGHQAGLDGLDCISLLDLDMSLGEGTGAAIGMWLIELGERILHEMATFEEAQMAEDEEVI